MARQARTAVLVACIFAALVAGVWAGYSAYRAKAKVAPNVTEPKSDDTQKPSEPAPKRVPAGWIRAEPGMWGTLDGVGVEVGEVTIGKVGTGGELVAFESDEPYLRVPIRLRFKGTGKAPVYRPWHATLSPNRTVARLRDEHENILKSLSFGIHQIKGQAEGEMKLDPDGTPVDDLLVFEKPLSNSTELYLELPGENVGRVGVFCFRFPAPKPVKSP